MFTFNIQSSDGYARTGVFTTAHGDIQTPCFMPVGTNATVKGLTREQIKLIGSEIILANTYHLHLRPGADIIEEFGGLHDFMGVDLPILTDSGGFQVFSLAKTRSGKSFVKIGDEGVEFRSHLNGDKHFFTPEKAMQVQGQLGADIVMAFDDVAPGDADHARARRALERTHRWAERCLVEHENIQKTRKKNGQHEQAYFPIIQGVTYRDLRVESNRFLRDLPTPGIAIGGLSVGEGKKAMLDMLDLLGPELPTKKPHYLMGVGTPEDVVESIARGIDMWDCVLPTRLGRHNECFSSTGNMKLINERYKRSQDSIPVKEGLETYVSQNYTLGYLRHLCNTGEMLGQQLLSMHNIEFLINITKLAREAIQKGEYEKFRKDFWQDYKM